MSTVSPNVRIRVSSRATTKLPMWFIKHAAFIGNERNMPGIVNLLARPMDITEQWQYELRAINYNMSLQHVSQIMDFRRAYANGTGVSDPTDLRKNFILREDLDAQELPQFDKVRTNIRATHTGSRASDQVQLFTLNGNQPPPLKPGRRHPTRVNDANIDDYLYTPEKNREFFFAANIYKSDGSVVPWPNGGLYPWFENGKTPVTWLPFVSRFPITIWAGYLEPVTEILSPYWSSELSE